MTQDPVAPMKTAEDWKNDANKLFQGTFHLSLNSTVTRLKAGKYDEAEKLYTKAIELDPTVPAYWSNRSFANLKLENNGYAIRDADEALKLDPSFLKVVKYAPNDRDAQLKLSEVEKMVYRIEFERAIAFEEKSVVERIQLADMAVESDYDGMLWNVDTDPISDAFIQDMTQRFRDQMKIHRKYAYKILLDCKRVLEACPSLVDIKVTPKFTVCGDVHGQYYDLLNIFEKNGSPSAEHGYLFNGDFVDRGSFSAEVILLLFAYKLRFPDSFHLTRGNHETDNMNMVYGFEGEVKAKYSQLMFKLFSEVFCALPLGFVIESRVFVTHGGLFSRDDVTLDELRKIDRFCQPSNTGLMCEMLWSDPQQAKGRGPSKRGIGLDFGPDVTATFLERNNLDMMFRSHEVKQEGFQMDHGGKCVTIFSAPNYCDQVGNKGAYINISKKNPSDESDRPELEYDYVTFEAVPHPSVKPMQYANGGMRGMF